MFAFHRRDILLLRSMFCQFHLMSLFLPLTVSMVSVYGGNRLAPVYWNSSNPLFNQSLKDRVLVVNRNDKMDIVCPRYDKGTPKHTWEYYIIYRVSREEFDNCIIYNPANVTKIVNCSVPTEQRYFTLLIKTFQPVPGVMDFIPGKSYFFITTSKGSAVGLNNQLAGACKRNQMKIIVNITDPQQEPTRRPTPSVTRITNRPTTASTYSQTRPTPRPTTTTRTTTTTTRTTVTTTTQKPHTKTKRPDYPDNPGKDTIIDATGPKNMGLINKSCILQSSMLVPLYCLLLSLWTIFVVR